MKTVLILSPRFPPVDGADIHRARMLIPYLPRFDWKPIVLAVDASCVAAPCDPLLTETIPEATRVRRVKALPERLTRRLGFSDIGLRAYPFLMAAGVSLIHRYRPDLVYLSTTAFFSMTLGRVWRALLGTPFVVDMQDPWASPPPSDATVEPSDRKRKVARLAHRRLEAWTMPHASGLIAVSKDYIDELHERYLPLRDKPYLVLPFGASMGDFELLSRRTQPNTFFQPDAGCLNGVYLGRGGEDMKRALRIIFSCFRKGLDEYPDEFAKIRLHFIGTDYASDDRARHRVLPLAQEFDLLNRISEHPSRVPYFQGLQILKDSDFLLIPGSDDSRYTASKILPYVLTRKPLLAVFHRNSNVVDLLNTTNGEPVVCFGTGSNDDKAIRQLYERWVRLLKRPGRILDIDEAATESLLAEATAERQCQLFDRVLANACKLSHTQGVSI